MLKIGIIHNAQSTVRYDYSIFAARRWGPYIVDQDILLIDSLENTNINVQISQRQKHAANINQIDINLTLLHWIYGASDICMIYFMPPPCNWNPDRYGQQQLVIPWKEAPYLRDWNITWLSFDGLSHIYNLPFFLELYVSKIFVLLKIICPLYLQWYHNVIKRDGNEINWIWMDFGFWTFIAVHVTMSVEERKLTDCLHSQLFHHNAI